MKVYINGNWTEEENATISINNPGFTSARVVYETIRTYKGRLFKFKRHYERLKNSADAMKIDLKKSLKEVETIIQEGIGINHLEEAYIRIYLTSNPDLIVQIKNFPVIDSNIYKTGILTDISEIRRQAFMHNSTAIKTTAALDVYLSRIKKPEQLYDTIMLNREGYVAEGTFSNVFAVKNGVLITPCMETGILSGITREVVIELSGQCQIRCEQRLVEEKELFESDELFLTHTSGGIVPVKALGKKVYQIGEISLRLMDSLQTFIG